MNPTLHAPFQRRAVVASLGHTTKISLTNVQRSINLKISSNGLVREASTSAAVVQDAKGAANGRGGSRIVSDGGDPFDFGAARLDPPQSPVPIYSTSSRDVKGKSKETDPPPGRPSGTPTVLHPNRTKPLSQRYRQNLSSLPPYPFSDGYRRDRIPTVHNSYVMARRKIERNRIEEVESRDLFPFIWFHLQSGRPRSALEVLEGFLELKGGISPNSSPKRRTSVAERSDTERDKISVSDLEKCLQLFFHYGHHDETISCAESLIKAGFRLSMKAWTTLIKSCCYPGLRDEVSGVVGGVGGVAVGGRGIFDEKVEEALGAELGLDIGSAGNAEGMGNIAEEGEGLDKDGTDHLFDSFTKFSNDSESGFIKDETPEEPEISFNPLTVDPVHRNRIKTILSWLFESNVMKRADARLIQVVVELLSRLRMPEWAEKFYAGYLERLAGEAEAESRSQSRETGMAEGLGIAGDHRIIRSLIKARGLVGDVRGAEEWFDRWRSEIEIGDSVDLKDVLDHRGMEDTATMARTMDGATTGDGKRPSSPPEGPYLALLEILIRKSPARSRQPVNLIRLMAHDGLRLSTPVYNSLMSHELTRGTTDGVRRVWESMISKFERLSSQEAPRRMDHWDGRLQHRPSVSADLLCTPDLRTYGLLFTSWKSWFKFRWLSQFSQSTSSSSLSSSDPISMKSESRRKPGLYETSSVPVSALTLISSLPSPTSLSSPRGILSHLVQSHLNLTFNRPTLRPAHPLMTTKLLNLTLETMTLSRDWEAAFAVLDLFKRCRVEPDEETSAVVVLPIVEFWRKGGLGEVDLEAALDPVPQGQTDGTAVGSKGETGGGGGGGGGGRWSKEAGLRLVKKVLGSRELGRNSLHRGPSKYVAGTNSRMDGADPNMGSFYFDGGEDGGTGPQTQRPTTFREMERLRRAEFRDTSWLKRLIERCAGLPRGVGLSDTMWGNGREPTGGRKPVGVRRRLTSPNTDLSDERRQVKNPGGEGVIPTGNLSPRDRLLLDDWENRVKEVWREIWPSRRGSS